MISSLHPDPFRECINPFFSYVDYFTSNVHHKLFIFFVLFTTQNISIDRALCFQIFSGILLKRTVQKLIYYYLSHEETALPLEVCTLLFELSLYYFYTNTVSIHKKRSILLLSVPIWFINFLRDALCPVLLRTISKSCVEK